MYYKIENKECDVYKKLHEMRSKEIQFDLENIEAVKLKAGSDFGKFLGHNGQQNFGRVRQYIGFEFLESDKIDSKIWKLDDKGIYTPNRKTKGGREMSEFLLNGIKKGKYTEPYQILGLEYYGSFAFPFVDIVGELVVLYLDDKHEPKDENMIEITKREFSQLFA